jgi:predicted nucleic acid-binding protein
MSDAYLLDTNIASALWDELHLDHNEFWEKTRRLDGSTIYISVITLAEIEYGLRVAPSIDIERQKKVRARMGEFAILPFDRHVVESYAKLRSRLFVKHGGKDKQGRLRDKVVPDLWERTPDKLLGIQENDLWQASLAVERNLVLVTNDRMSRIVEVAGNDLRIESWRK